MKIDKFKSRKITHLSLFFSFALTATAEVRETSPNVWNWQQNPTVADSSLTFLHSSQEPHQGVGRCKSGQGFQTPYRSRTSFQQRNYGSKHKSLWQFISIHPLSQHSAPRFPGPTHSLGGLCLHWATASKVEAIYSRLKTGSSKGWGSPWGSGPRSHFFF